MREYKCIEIKREMKNTEKMLNEAAGLGWKVICSYSYLTRYLILEREAKK